MIYTMLDKKKGWGKGGKLKIIDKETAALVKVPPGPFQVRNRIYAALFSRRNERTN